MTAPINNYPHNNLENIMALSKSIRESSANVTSSCDLNTQDTVTLSRKVQGTEEKLPEQIEDNGKKSDSDFNKSDIASSIVDLCRDALLKDIDAVTSGETSNQGLLGKLQALAKKHPKIATFIKYFGKAAGPVINIASGTSEGKKVASKHYNGNAEHDTLVREEAITSGTVGALAGGAIGAAAGAIAGSAVCPGFGTVVGLIVGFCASNYLSSKGAEIGAKRGEERHMLIEIKRSIAEDRKNGMSLEDISRKYRRRYHISKEGFNKILKYNLEDPYGLDELLKE